jgi:hypothetical protein
MDGVGSNQASDRSNETHMTDIARSIISLYMNAGMDRDAAISATILDLHREAGLTVKDAWEHVWGTGSYSRMVAQIQTAI